MVHLSHAYAPPFHRFVSKSGIKPTPGVGSPGPAKSHRCSQNQMIWIPFEIVRPLLRNDVVVPPEPEKYLWGALHTAHGPGRSIVYRSILETDCLVIQQVKHSAFVWLRRDKKHGLDRLKCGQHLAGAFQWNEKVLTKSGACIFRSPRRENLVAVIRNFISGVRFTKWAGRSLEAWLLRTENHCAPGWLGAARREEPAAWSEDQTWLKPSTSKSNKLSKKRQGPGTRESEKTKKLLFCPDERQETSFNLIACIWTFSSKLILMPLIVKIFWPRVEIR